MDLCPGGGRDQKLLPRSAAVGQCHHVSGAGMGRGTPGAPLVSDRHLGRSGVLGVGGHFYYARCHGLFGPVAQWTAGTASLAVFPPRLWSARNVSRRDPVHVCLVLVDHVDAGGPPVTDDGNGDGDSEGNNQPTNQPTNQKNV